MLIVYLPLVLLLLLVVLVGFMIRWSRYHSPEQTNARRMDRDDEAHWGRIAAEQKARTEREAALTDA